MRTLIFVATLSLSAGCRESDDQSAHDGDSGVDAVVDGTRDDAGGTDGSVEDSSTPPDSSSIDVANDGTTAGDGDAGIDAAEVADAGETFDATDAADAGDAVDATDATDAADSRDATDAIDAIDAKEASSDTTDAGPSPRIVFVTSVGYAANLGGLAGADAKCQSLAAAASLVGTFRAFLSDSATSASARLTHASAAYVLTTGTPVASSATTFFSITHLVPIDRDENGNNVGASEVWTGSGGTGVGSGGGCNDWTNNSSSAPYPAVGATNQSNGAWANVYLQFCDRVGLRLYCVQQ